MNTKNISAIVAIASAAGLLAVISPSVPVAAHEDASVGTGYPDQYCQEDERIHEKYGIGSPEDIAFHQEEGKGPCADVGVDTSA
jgi:hypothetical protein